MTSIRLPKGFAAGHWDDPVGLTGCTVLLAPAGAVGAADIRGGATGSRESELLTPAAVQPGPDAVLFTGGSAFGLPAAEGVARWLGERGRGYPTPTGPVPLVPAFVVYDLGLGDPEARPDAGSGYAACAAASSEVEAGSRGAGRGCTVGKALGASGWMRGGLGVATAGLPGGASVCALAAVNAFGDVVAEDGTLLAGPRRRGSVVRTTALLAAEAQRPDQAPPPVGQSTTLVCVVTDARLTKLDAWHAARAASAGMARAIDPVWTLVDGDVTVCVAAGDHPADPLALGALAADLVAAAIRSAIRRAAGVPGCPAAAEPAGSGTAGPG